MEFTGLKVQKDILSKKIKKRISKVLDHGRYILGPEVAELEEQLADYISVKNCISCSSGTDALLMSLMAAKVGNGDAVITTPFTYIATAEVIEILGAKTYFCDINPDTFNLEVNNLQETYDVIINDGLTPRAIIAVDIFGLPCRFRALEDFAKLNSLFLIEDMAQSFGANIKGNKAGTFGDIGATSFFPSKPLGCYGDGGALFTNDDELAELIRSIRVHGSGENKYDNIMLGLNARLDTLQAAILLEKLTVFEEELESRKNIAKYYEQNLPSSLGFQLQPKGYSSARALFSILARDQFHRKLILQRMELEGISYQIYYSKPLHKQKLFSQEINTEMKISENISSRIFSVPFHPYLEKVDQEKVLEILNHE